MILTYWSQTTGGERISKIAFVTRARGNMIDNAALRIHATQPGTRVNTVQVAARLGRRTVCIDSTFRSACYIRIAKVILDASACGCPVAIGAQSVLTARRWVARIWPFGLNYRC